MPYSRLALVLAVLIAVIGVGELVYFSHGYLPRQWAPIVVWAAGPPLLGYWLATRLVRSRAGAMVVCAALGLSLALGAFGAWDVTLGPGRNESLGGLVVIMMPAYQNAILLAGLVVTGIVEWRARSASGGARPGRDAALP